MIIKFFGLFMIVSSCFLVGLSIYEQYYRRIVFLKDYMNFIIYIKSEISYTQSPIKNILGRYNKSSCLKRHISKLLQNLKTNSLECSWHLVFHGISKENGVLLEEENTIAEFGKQLGICDTETQTKILNYHIKTIDTYLKEATMVKKSKGNLPIVLALCFGLFIAIIFI